LQPASGPGAVRESHPRILAAKRRVGEARGASVEPRSAKRVAVGGGKRVHLGRRAEILVPAQRHALRLTVGREARLVEGGADAGPSAEAAYLWRHRTEKGFLRLGFSRRRRWQAPRVAMSVV